LDPDVDQTERDLLDDVRQLRVGDVVPDTVPLVAHGYLLGMLNGRIRD
jgi:hypothetical protein